MKKASIKIVSLVLALTLAIGACVLGFAADKSNVQQYKTYTCLGDSIAAGMYTSGYVAPMQPSPNAYHSVLAKAVGAEVYNCGFGAFRTHELRYLLDDTYDSYSHDEYGANTTNDALFVSRAKLDSVRPFVRDCIKKSDLVTVHIGSNDLVTQFWTNRNQKYSLFEGFETILTKLFPGNAKVQDAVAELHSTGNTLNFVFFMLRKIPKALSDFKENWDAIYAGIRNLNTNCAIVALSAINPMNCVTLSDNIPIKAGKIFDILFNYINKYISTMSHHSHKYIYCDVTDIPLGEGCSFIGVEDLRSALIAPSHPSVEEHAMIANRIISVLPASGESGSNTTWTYSNPDNQ